MDDYLDFFDDPQTAVKIITDVAALLKLRGFNLAKFISSSRDILKKKISPRNLSPKIVNLDLDEIPIERALGVSWNPYSDMVTFKTVNENILEIKRGILSILNTQVYSIFNPMGIISPIIVKTELSIQEM